MESKSYMWEIEQLKFQKKNSAKIKIQNFEFETPGILTGIFWLKHISASHCKHFTI